MWGSVFNPQQFRNTAYKRPLNIDNNILKINIDFIFFARCDMDKKMFAQREFLLLIPPIQESITLWQRAVEAIFGRDLTYFIWSSNFWPRKVKIPQILFISHQQFIRAHSCPPPSASNPRQTSHLYFEIRLEPIINPLDSGSKHSESNFLLWMWYGKAELWQHTWKHNG